MGIKKKSLLWWITIILFIAIIVVFLIVGCDYKHIDGLEMKNIWRMEIKEEISNFDASISDDGREVTLLYDGKEPIKITEDTSGIPLPPLYSNIYGEFNRNEDGTEIIRVVIYTSRRDNEKNVLVEFNRE